MYDAAGKLLDVAGLQRSGGRVRDRVPLYVHGWGSIPQNVALGFDAFKTDPIPWSRVEGHPEAPQAPRAQRSEAELGPSQRGAAGGVDAPSRPWRGPGGRGPDVELLVECHGRFNADQALEFLRGSERYKPAFVEEPVPPDDWNGWKRLARRSNVPLAGGERIFTRFGWRRSRGRAAFDRAAGLYPLRRPDGGEKALGHGRRLLRAHGAPNSSGPVATMASVHVDATLSNFYRQEFIQQKTFEDLFVDRRGSRRARSCSTTLGPAWGSCPTGSGSRRSRPTGRSTKGQRTGRREHRNHKARSDHGPAGRQHLHLALPLMVSRLCRTYSTSST